MCLRGTTDNLIEFAKKYLPDALRRPAFQATVLRYKQLCVGAKASSWL